MYCEHPCVDVYLEDVEDPSNTFEPTFVNMLSRGYYRVTSLKPVGKLRIRCLEFGI